MYMFPCPTTAGGMANPIRRSHTRNPLRSSFAPPLVGIYGPNEIARARVAYLKAGTDSAFRDPGQAEEGGRLRQCQLAVRRINRCPTDDDGLYLRPKNTLEREGRVVEFDAAR